MRDGLAFCLLLACVSAACQSQARPPQNDASFDPAHLDARKDAVPPAPDAGTKPDLPPDRAGREASAPDAAGGQPDGAGDTADTPPAPDAQPAPVDSRGSDALVLLEGTCSPESGTAVSYTQPATPFGCAGMDDLSTLLVIENDQQLAAAKLRFPCLPDLAAGAFSFASGRLVIAPVRGTVRWVNEIGGAVVIAVLLYAGPAPGSQPFPLALVLPRSGSPVRARYCQGSSGCVGSVCPP